MRSSAAGSIVGPTSLTTSRATGVLRLRREHDAEQAAHRRADPADGLGAASRDERGQHREIRREDVVVGIGEPVAAPATGHVDRQHAMRAASAVARSSKSRALRPTPWTQMTTRGFAGSPHSS